MGHSSWILSAAWSPCCLRIATVDKNEILIWKSKTGVVERRVEPVVKHRVDSGVACPELSCVAFSPDGRLLAASGKAVVLWHTGSWERIRSFNHSAAVSLSFSPDSRKLACGGPKGVDVWDLENGRSLCYIPASQGCVSFCPDGPDGCMLATCGHSYWPTITLWTVPRIFTGGVLYDGTMCDEYHDKPLRRLHGHTGRRPCKCKEGPNASCPVQGHQPCFFNCPLSFSPGGLQCASGGDDTIKIWDHASGRVLRPIDLPDDVGAMAWGIDVEWERAERALARAMGLHARLGGGSRIRALDPALVQMVLMLLECAERRDS